MFTLSEMKQSPTCPSGCHKWKGETTTQDTQEDGKRALSSFKSQMNYNKDAERASGGD